MIVPIDYKRKKIASGNVKNILYINISDDFTNRMCQDLRSNSKLPCVVSKRVFTPQLLKDDCDEYEIAESVSFTVNEVYSNMFNAICAYGKEMMKYGDTQQLYYDDIYGTYSVNLGMNYRVMFSVRKVLD